MIVCLEYLVFGVIAASVLFCVVAVVINAFRPPPPTPRRVDQSNVTVRWDEDA